MKLFTGRQRDGASTVRQQQEMWAASRPPHRPSPRHDSFSSLSRCSTCSETLSPLGSSSYGSSWESDSDGELVHTPTRRGRDTAYTTVSSATGLSSALTDVSPRRQRLKTIASALARSAAPTLALPVGNRQPFGPTGQPSVASLVPPPSPTRRGVRQAAAASPPVAVQQWGAGPGHAVAITAPPSVTLRTAPPTLRQAVGRGAGAGPKGRARGRAGAPTGVLTTMQQELKYLRGLVRSLTRSKVASHRRQWTEVMPDSVAMSVATRRRRRVGRRRAGTRPVSRHVLPLGTPTAAATQVPLMDDLVSAASATLRRTPEKAVVTRRAAPVFKEKHMLSRPTSITLTPPRVSPWQGVTMLPSVPGSPAVSAPLPSIAALSHAYTPRVSSPLKPSVSTAPVLAGSGPRSPGLAVSSDDDPWDQLTASPGRT